MDGACAARGLNLVYFLVGNADGLPGSAAHSGSLCGGEQMSAAFRFTAPENLRAARCAAKLDGIDIGLLNWFVAGDEAST